METSECQDEIKMLIFFIHNLNEALLEIIIILWTEQNGIRN